MKKLFALLTIGLLALGGCKMGDSTELNAIYYGYYLYPVNQATIEVSPYGNYLMVSGGSRSNYADPSVSSAFYTALTVWLGDGDPDAGWEGEYTVSLGGTNTMEFGEKYFDSSTNQVQSYSYIHEVLSGTVTVKYVSGNRYTVDFNGYTDQLVSFKGHYDGDVSVISE